MAEDATFEITLDSALRDDFVAEAEASHRSAQDVIREYMATFVAEQRLTRGREDGDYDAWFRAQVHEALEEANSPDAVFFSHEEVVKDWERRKAHLLSDQK